MQNSPFYKMSLEKNPAKGDSYHLDFVRFAEDFYKTLALKRNARLAYGQYNNNNKDKSR